MVRQIWLLSMMMVLAACGSGLPPIPNTTLIPSGQALPGCDAGLVAAWDMKFGLPTTAQNDLKTIQALAAAFTNTNYPSCVSEARIFALQVYDFAARAAESTQANAISQADEYHEQQAAAMQSYMTAMEAVTPNTLTLPLPLTTKTLDCPNITATCEQLNCAETFACYLAGNTALDGDEDGIPCACK